MRIKWDALKIQGRWIGSQKTFRLASIKNLYQFYNNTRFQQNTRSLVHCNSLWKYAAFPKFDFPNSRRNGLFIRFKQTQPKLAGTNTFATRVSTFELELLTPKESPAANRTVHTDAMIGFFVNERRILIMHMGRIRNERDRQANEII
jgi:hypothetical protein